MLRNIIIIGIFSCLFLQVRASHVAGGEITYRYIGDSTGIARHYLIQLRAFRNEFGLNYGSYQVVTYSSSCHPGDTLHVNLINGFPSLGRLIDNRHDCSGITNFVRYREHIYQREVILPVNCSDWTFTYSICCRSAALNNIIIPSGTAYIIKAHLNNNQGQNSSPQFIHPATRYFSIHNPDTSLFFQGALESDGDSLYYYLGHPEELPLPGSPVSFAQGYSVDTPFTSSSGVHIDHATGTIKFKPTQIELNSFKINVDEFRFSPTIGAWIKVGTVMREIPVFIGGTYDSLGANWTISGSPVVNNNIDYTKGATCGSKNLAIYSSVPFNCETLAPDGSDFLIYKKDGTLLPIIGASTLCDRGYSNEIILELYDTLSVNDTMHIVSHIGSDFNSLSGYCGFQLDQGDSLQLIVSGCPNLSLNEPAKSATSIYPNPAGDWVELRFPFADEKKIEMYSLSGDLVLQERLNNKTLTLDLSSISPGLYTIRIETKDEIKNIRLIRH